MKRKVLEFRSSLYLSSFGQTREKEIETKDERKLAISETKWKLSTDRYYHIQQEPILISNLPVPSTIKLRLDKKYLFNFPKDFSIFENILQIQRFPFGLPCSFNRKLKSRVQLEILLESGEVIREYTIDYIWIRRAILPMPLWLLSLEIFSKLWFQGTDGGAYFGSGGVMLGFEDTWFKLHIVVEFAKP